MALMPSRGVAARTRLHRLVLAIPIAATASMVLHAATESAAISSQREGERQLEEGRTTLDSGTLSGARNAFAECLRQDPHIAQCAFDLARTESYLIKSEDIATHTDASKQWLDRAISDAQKAIVINDHFADTHALLADLYGAKITGAFSGMRYGPKANAESARALQLDPNNALAFAVLGRKRLFAPSAFGGDVDKAIESFKRATVTDPHSDEDLVWLAIAYRKKGDKAHQQEALTQALRLNSRSVFAHRVQSGQE